MICDELGRSDPVDATSCTVEAERVDRQGVILSVTLHLYDEFKAFLDL